MSDNYYTSHHDDGIGLSLTGAFVETKCEILSLACIAAGEEMTSATDLPGNNRDRIERMSSLFGARRSPTRRSSRAPTIFWIRTSKKKVDY